MSLHLNLSTGKFLNSSTLFKLSDALVLDVSSGEIVMSNLLVPRAVSVSSSPTLFGDATLDLNFASSLSLDDAVSGNNLVTFSRASTGTYVGSDGLIKTSAVNLVTYSEQFDNTAWFKSGTSVTPNNVISPDGTLTADTIEFTASAGFIGQFTLVTTPGVQATLSFYAKNIDGNANLLLRGTNASTLYSTPITITNEWARYSVTYTHDGSTHIGFVLQDSNPSGQGSTAIWGAQLEKNSTASTYVPTTNLPSGAPRFDHDPVTGESLGLLIEESRTNLLTFSSTLDAYGTSSIASKTQNAGIAPDGTNTAVLAETISTGNDSHLRTSTSQAVNTTYTYSFFAKPGTVDYAVVYNIAKNSVGLTWFNVANGTIGTTASGVTPFIKPAGNGWYRVGVTLTTDSTITNNLVDIRWALEDGVNAPIQGENIYVWGVQLEAGSFPTSYVPTTTSAVTRATDLASITGTNFSSWYNQSEGTMFAEYDGLKEYARVINLNAGRSLINSRSTINQAYDGVTATASQADLGLTLGDTRKVVTAYSGTTTTLTISGLAPVTGASDFTSTTTTEAFLGGQGNNTNVLNGHISRLSYFPTRKTDEDLIELTT